jgi:hypothetical protein
VAERGPEGAGDTVVQRLSLKACGSPCPSAHLADLLVNSDVMQVGHADPIRAGRHGLIVTEHGKHSAADLELAPQLLLRFAAAAASRFVEAVSQHRAAVAQSLRPIVCLLPA